MKIQLTILLCAITTSLFGLHEVAADRGVYRRGRLELSGAVDLAHPFGRISCDNAELYAATRGALAGSLAEQAVARGNVIVTLTDHGVLQCDYAHLDTAKNLAEFESTYSGHLISYDAQRVTQDGHVIPMTLLADQLTIAMEETAKGPQAREVEARGRVSLIYNRENHVRAAYGRYLVDRASGSSSVHLVPSSSRPCVVEDGQGNRIEAERIDVALHEEVVRLDRPRGLLAAGDDAPVEFSCHDLEWGVRGERLTLQGAVRVEQSSFGRLETDDLLTIDYSSNVGERRIDRIETRGDALLVYAKRNPEYPQEVRCAGPAEIDLVAQRIVLQGGNGSVLLSDRAGVVKADRVQVTYVRDGGAVQLTHLLLQGSVLLQNTAALDPTDDSPVHQIAMGDELEYVPSEERMDLRANAGGRVIFYDLVNNLQMSAPAVRVQRDALTQQHAVRGLGDVRFTLQELETKRLESLTADMDIREDKWRKQ